MDNKNEKQTAQDAREQPGATTQDVLQATPLEFPQAGEPVWVLVREGTHYPASIWDEYLLKRIEALDLKLRNLGALVEYSLARLEQDAGAAIAKGDSFLADRQDEIKTNLKSDIEEVQTELGIEISRLENLIEEST